VIKNTLPTPARCFKLGQHLRKAILFYPEDMKVEIGRHRGPLHQKMIGDRRGASTNEAGP